MAAAIGELPGVAPPGGPEPTLEWVRPGPGMVGALSARLGSDPDAARELVLAVMRCLRGWLAQDTWDGVVEELPYELRATLRSTSEPPPPRLLDRADLIENVARAVRHPFQRTALEVNAAFASMKRALPRGLADAIVTELPAAAAELWRSAR